MSLAITLRWEQKFHRDSVRNLRHIPERTRRAASRAPEARGAMMSAPSSGAAALIDLHPIVELGQV